MNNQKTFDIYEKITHFTLYDIIISLLVLSSLSFYDVKLVFLGIQFIAFAMTFAQIFIRKSLPKHVLAYICWLFVFSFYGYASSLWISDRNTTSVLVTLSVIQVGLIAVCIMLYVHNHPERFIKLINIFILSACIISIRFFIDVPISAWGKEARFSEDTLFGGNIPAMIMSFSVVYLFYYVFIKHLNDKRKIAIFLISLFTLITLLMGTKKGLLIITIGVVFLWITHTKNPVKLLTRTVISIAICVIVYSAIMRIPVLYGSIGYRIDGMIKGFQSGQGDASTNARIKFISDALRVFNENKLLGVGQDGYRYENIYEPVYSHNNYVEILANLGILGFITYYSIFVVTLVKAFKKWRNNLLPITTIIIMLIIDVSMVSYSCEMSYVLFALCLSFVQLKENTNVEKNI